MPLVGWLGASHRYSNKPGIVVMGRSPVLAHRAMCSQRFERTFRAVILKHSIDSLLTHSY
jgi:hypothetical protein